MTIGGAFALTLRIPDKIQAIAQNFSAGLLISAVAGELYPLMAPPGLDSVSASIAVTIGFACGLAFMLGLGAIPSGEQDEEDSGGAEPTSPRGSFASSLLDPGEQAQALKGFAGIADRLKADVRQLRDRIQAGGRDEIDEVVNECRTTWTKLACLPTYLTNSLALLSTCFTYLLYVLTYCAYLLNCVIRSSMRCRATWTKRSALSP